MKPAKIVRILVAGSVLYMTIKGSEGVDASATMHVLFPNIALMMGIAVTDKRSG